MGKIICFGAGQYIVNNQNIILNHEDKLVAIIDNNESKWGNIFMGTSIISPKQILGLDYDLIVITSIYEDEIRKQLKLLGVSDKKIFSLMEYKARLFAINQRKNKNYKTADTYKVNFDGKKIVYTAIMGEYDNLLDPAVINQDVDYVCFTNNKRLKSDIWNIEYVSSEKLDDMHFAKYYKVFPNLFFSEYPVSIWIDGKFQIIGDINQYINTYAGTSPMICFPHFSRTCLYEEAAECIVSNRGNKEDILRQISDYYRDKYPLNNGLYEMGCIVRRHNEDQVINLMSEWWFQINKYSYRDQISFPYVCWKNNFQPDISIENIYKNTFLRYFPHKNEKKYSSI